MACSAGYDWCKDEHSYRPTIDHDEYCIFHAPADYKLDKHGHYTHNVFNDYVYNKINDCIKRNVACNLSGTIFPYEIWFSRFNKSNPLPLIIFEGCEFVERAVFEETTFSKLASFHETIFNSGAIFNDTVFHETANFIGAQFKNVRFNNATFESSAHFESAKFVSGSAYFDDITFGFDCIFEGALFENDNTVFDYSEMYGETNLRATFNCNVSFKFTEFHGEAYFSIPHLPAAVFKGFTDFSYSSFHEIADFTSVRFNEALFLRSYDYKLPYFHMDAKFTSLVIENKIKFHNINLQHASFILSDIRKIDFIECDWDNLDSRDQRHILHDEKLLFDKIGKPTKEHIPLIRSVESLYRAQKEKSGRDSNQYEYSLWHYSEKEMQRKRTILFQPYHTATAWLQNAFKWLALNTYSLISGYGENPLRAGIVLLLLLLAAMVAIGLYGIVPADTIAGTDLPWNSRTVLFKLGKYSSSLTIPCTEFGKVFTTTLEHLTFQKHVDYKPYGMFGSFLKMVFQFLTLTQFTLFAFALRNRFRR